MGFGQKPASDVAEHLAFIRKISMNDSSSPVSNTAPVSLLEVLLQTKVYCDAAGRYLSSIIEVHLSER